MELVVTKPERETNRETKAKILKTFGDQFKGIGTIPGEYKIKTDEQVTPVVHPPRRVPYI